MPCWNSIYLCHLCRARPSCISSQLQILILISPKLLMDYSRNERCTSPFNRNSLWQGLILLFFSINCYNNIIIIINFELFVSLWTQCLRSSRHISTYHLLGSFSGSLKVCIYYIHLWTFLVLNMFKQLKQISVIYCNNMHKCWRVTLQDCWLSLACRTSEIILIRSLLM